MAKRNRFHEMESLMTKVILGDTVLFVLYLIFASSGLMVPKFIVGVAAMIISLLALGWLYITGEFPRRRSLWMITGFIGIAACLLVSMALRYPCPPIK